MKKLTKADLITNIHVQTGHSSRDINDVIDALCDEITNTLRAGASVTLPNLGTFKPTRREARVGRHPQTGEPLQIKASNGAGFKAGKALKDALN